MEEDMIYLGVTSQVEKLWMDCTLGCIGFDLTERIQWFNGALLL